MNECFPFHPWKLLGQMSEDDIGRVTLTIQWHINNVILKQANKIGRMENNNNKTNTTYYLIHIFKQTIQNLKFRCVFQLLCQLPSDSVQRYGLCVRYVDMLIVSELIAE